MNTPLPQAFRDRMRYLLGGDADDFFRALAAPPHTGLRVNTLKLSAERFESLAPWELEPVPWCPAGYVIRGDAQPGKHPFHAAGLYYLQEPSAMAVAEALAPRPGERVLDLAAAPGGKASHLLGLMGDRGLLVANEVHRGRTRALGENLERWGARRAVIVNEEPERLAEAWGPTFDRVLLDAPCSGEGMFRKSEDARAMWSESTVLGCARRQEHLLDSAAALVRPGGTLAYSTCTFAPEENEAVVAGFLGKHGDFELERPALPGATPGRAEWVSEGLGRPELADTVRLWPHSIQGEGHFIAVLKLKDGQPPRFEEAAFRPVPEQQRKLWRRFLADTMPFDPAAEAELTVFGDRLHAVPRGVPVLKGLRAVRAGLWLGTFLKDRFEPSHGLALALEPDQVSSVNRLELAPDDPRLLRYLQGDVLEEVGVDGWLLITVSGFAIGWGRRARDVIKNAYPKGLRWNPE